MPSASDTSVKYVDLGNRMDTLETRLTEVQHWRIENDVVNLTAAAGFKQAVSDIIDQKIPSSNANSAGKLTELVGRLDTLETRLAEIQEWRIEGATTSFEHDVANLTITAGIEQAVGDIIDRKVSQISSLAQDAFIETGQLKAELSKVERTLEILARLYNTSVSAISHNARIATAANHTVAADISAGRNQSAPLGLHNTHPGLNVTTEPHLPVDVSKLDLKALLRAGDPDSPSN